MPSTAEAVPPTQPSTQAVTIEVPLIEVVTSDQAVSQASLSDRKDDEEREEGEAEEEVADNADDDAVDDDDDDDDDDDERDARAKVPPKDEPDDQTGLLPEYMVAESVPDLTTADG